MSFMEPETYYGEYYEIDGNEGTFAVPAEVTGKLDVEDLEAFRDYYPGNRIESVRKEHGWLGRLSAPGYLDATDWTPYDADDEAGVIEQLEEEYGDDEPEDLEGVD